jgi:hypothetical protein
MAHRFLAVAIALVLTAAAAGSDAAMYKWVDEKGVVHYTDRMPAEAVDKGSVELNKQGIPLRRTEAAPTPEQRRARQLEEERARQVAREREVVDRRDRALMQSYSTAEEIDLARSRAVGTLEAQMQSAHAYSASLVKRREELEARRKAAGDKVPPAVERELEGIASELARQDALIAERKREIATVSARYEVDKQRWQELRAIALAKEGVAPAHGEGSPVAGSTPSAAGTAGAATAGTGRGAVPATPARPAR